MHTDIAIPASLLLGFLLVAARVSGLIIFVPLPGMQAAPVTARILLTLCLSVLLLPSAPAPPFLADAVSAGRLFILIGSELSFGLLIAVVVAFLLEALQIAAQMIGLQAGYSFASTIDPSTQADAGILQIIAQLFGGMLFFFLGFDRELIRILARSLTTTPIVAGLVNQSVIDAVVRLGSEMFVVGLRLSLPVVALLILMDLCFGIMGKVQAQLQVLSVSFSAKMLVGLAVLGTAVSGFPIIFELVAARSFHLLGRLLGS